MVTITRISPDVFCLPLGNLLANCYVIKSNGRALIIDPGDESDLILDLLKKEQLVPHAVLITHVHFDHVGAIGTLQQLWKVPVMLHQADEALIQNTLGWAESISDTYDGFQPTDYLVDGQELSFFTKTLKVMHTPGHSPGSVCFLMEGILFAGDLIFAQGGYGRTDLWGGSYEVIMNSLATKIFTLPAATVICSGHGPTSTVGDEQQYYDFDT